jgi:hypothetical protein
MVQPSEIGIRKLGFRFGIQDSEKLVEINGRKTEVKVPASAPYSLPRDSSRGSGCHHPNCRNAKLPQSNNPLCGSRRLVYHRSEFREDRRKNVNEDISKVKRNEFEVVEVKEN